MPWEKHQRGTAPRKGELAVSFLPHSGRAALSRPAHAALHDCEAVILLYDRERDLIGFEPTSREEPDSYLVGVSGSNRTVHVGSLLRRFDREDLAGTRYKARMEDGILVADLKQPLGAVERPERRAARQASEQLALPA